MTPRRVALVEFNPSGGLFQFAFQLGRGLAESGHEVFLLTGPRPEFDSPHPRMRVLPILPTWHPGDAEVGELRRRLRRGVRAGRHLAAWAVLARWIARERPDVVQWAEWRFGIDGLLASLITRAGWAGASVDLAHSPIPLEEQRSDGDLYRRGRLLEAGLRRGYESMDAVVVLGDRSLADLQRAWPGVRRSEVIPHGDESLYDAGSLPPPSASGRRALFFGTLTGYKGLPQLLAAFREVRRSLPDAELLIAGAVSADLDYPALAAEAAGIGGVEMRPGYVAAGDVAGLFGSARLVVAPYLRSNASGVVRLAHTLGRPVVVTDVGDLADSVADGVSGAVVPAGDVEALAGAVRRLLQEAESADSMGAEGRRRLGEEASWSVVAGRVSDLYDRLLATP